MPAAHKHGGKGATEARRVFGVELRTWKRNTEMRKRGGMLAQGATLISFSVPPRLEHLRVYAPQANDERIYEQPIIQLRDAGEGASSVHGGGAGELGGAGDGG